jgi:hypothetical protein
LAVFKHDPETVAHRFPGLDACDHCPIEDVDDLEPFVAEDNSNRYFLTPTFTAAFDSGDHGNWTIGH